MNTEMSNGDKWAALVKWIEDTDGDEDADIWNFLGDELGVEPDGSSKEEECEQCGCVGAEKYWWIEQKDETWNLCEACGIAEEQEKCDCGCLDDEDEDEYDTLDMKVLGFKTTERLDGNWNSLLFEIRNYGDDGSSKGVGPNLFEDWICEEMMKKVWEAEMKSNAEKLEFLNSITKERTKQNEELKQLSFEEWKKEHMVDIEEDEEEKDECEGCEKEVVVEYEDFKGYTIANCNNCNMMLCRDCLESGTADMCKYCVVSVVENFAENLNSYPKEKVDKIVAMMKEDLDDLCKCVICDEIFKKEEITKKIGGTDGCCDDCYEEKDKHVGEAFNLLLFGTKEGLE